MRSLAEQTDIVAWVNQEMLDDQHLNGHRAEFMENAVERVIRTLHLLPGERDKRDFLLNTYEGLYDEFLVRKYGTVYGEGDHNAEAEALDLLLGEIRKRFNRYL